jgi:PAS domain S-box-containing protein
MTTKPHEDARDDLIATRKMVVDQREANAQMVTSTIRAQELAEQAEVAKVLAEATTKELRESEERFRTLFELCPAAVYSCDRSGVIQNFNRHAAMMWGREPVLGAADERFCGSFKLFRPDGSFMPHDQCPMAEVLSGKLLEVIDAEVRVERPDGSRITCVVNIRPLKNQRGEVTGAINCFYDVTERKGVETRVSDSLNQERTLAEFREMFIGIVGHDLRNPLGSIDMAATLLIQRGHLDQRDAETAARILRGSQRISRMITQLLDLTRARLGGGLPIERAPTDLDEVCRNVVEEFGASIQLEVEGDVTGIWDPDRLAEVLSNLAGNAIEYRTPGTMVIVKARGDGADVVVEVSNQGEAIPPNVLPFIFVPFRRARQREKSPTGNLGLGLYIAHQIVLSHCGTLDVHCADGTTTFVVRLPRRPAPTAID